MVWGRVSISNFECVLAFRHPEVHKGFSTSNPNSLKTVLHVGFLTWLVGFEGPLLHGVDNVGHGDVGMEVGMIGHLGLPHVGAVSDGIDVAVTFHLEVLVYSQSAIAG